MGLVVFGAAVVLGIMIIGGLILFTRTVDGACNE